MAKEEMGAYKRKGAAESKYLSEDGDVIDQNKKTAGPGKGKMHMDKKVKGPGEYGGKKGDDSKSKKDYEGPGKGKMHMDKKGAAEYGGKKGDDSKSKKDYEGPGRSKGYTQNFGPARVNSYAKGAAKVNSIMGKGPAQDSPSPVFESLEMAAREGLLANTKQATSLGFVNSNFDPKSQSYSAKPVGVETFDNEKFLDGGNKPYKIRDPKAMKAFSKDSTSLAQRNKLEARTLNSLMDKENKRFGM